MFHTIAHFWLDGWGTGGGPTDVPVSDVLALSEAAAVTVLFASADAGSLSETSSLATVLAAADAGSLSEASVLDALLTRSDTASLSEAVSAAAAAAASDTASVSEFTTNAQQQNITGNDAASVSESSSVQAVNFLLVSDTLTLIESQALSVLLDVLDHADFAEAAALTAQIAVVQGISLAESSALVASFTGLDASALTESAQTSTLSVTMLDASDLLTMHESVGVEAQEFTSPVVVSVGPRLGSLLIPRGRGYFTDVRPNQGLSRWP